MPLQDGEQGVSALNWDLCPSRDYHPQPQGRTQVPSPGPTQPRLQVALTPSYLQTVSPTHAKPQVHLDAYLVPRNCGEHDTVLVVKDRQQWCHLLCRTQAGWFLGTAKKAASPWASGSQSPFRPPHLWNVTSWLLRGHLCPWLNQGTEAPLQGQAPSVPGMAYRMESHPPGAHPRLPLSSQSQKSNIFIILQILLKRDLVEKIYKAF